MKQFLETGKIVSTHGLKGEVKIQPWSNSPEFLCEFDSLYIDNGQKTVVIENARVQKNTVIMKLEGIDTPEQAIAMRNKILFIDRADIELEEGCYFVQDLIGLQVSDVDSSEIYGEIIDVTETGANDVYHIKAEDGKMYYIPAIPDVVIDTDIAEKKMLIRPLKGLFDNED